MSELALESLLKISIHLIKLGIDFFEPCIDQLKFSIYLVELSINFIKFSIKLDL